MEVSNTGAIAMFMTSGNQALYGSKIMHHNYITLKIFNSKGGDTLDLNDKRDVDITPLIEVKLSMLQFAEAITQVGKGLGTPCTISRYDGKSLPQYKLPDQKKSLLDFAGSKIDESIATIDAVIKVLDKRLDDGSKLSKLEMTEIVNSLHRMKSKGFFEYVDEMMNRIFEKSIADAKQQLEGHYVKFMGNIENKENTVKLSRITEETKMNMSKILGSIKSEILPKYLKKNKINFDTENDEMVEEKIIEVSRFKFVCQHWRAGGDWENPIDYFFCQTDSYLFDSTFAEDGLFVFVPTENNPNLQKDGNSYSATHGDDADCLDTDPKIWDELKEYIEQQTKKSQYKMGQ